MSESLHRFDAFELNWNTRQLFREGQPVAVEPKALELIRYLLMHRHRAVDKDELAAALWPERVISDSVISQTVRKARAAVGDDGERQEIIQTVRGFGYRFVANPVRTSSEPAASRSAESSSLFRGRNVLLMLAVTALGLGIWLYEPDLAQAPELRSAAIVPGVDISATDAQPWLAEAVTDVVHSILSESPDWAVVPGSVVAAQLELADNRSSAMTELFGQLGVTHVIHGELAGGDGQWDLVFRVLDRSGEESLIRAGGELPLKLALQTARGISATAYAQGAQELGQWLEDEWLAETYFRGIGAMRQGDADAAASLFSATLEFNPGHAWTRYQLATARSAQGRYLDAAELLEDLVYDSQLEIEQPQLHRLAANALGVTWWYRGDLATASDYFRIMADSGRAAHHLLNAANGELNLGMAYSTRGQFEQAEQHYIEAMALYSKAGYKPGRAHVANALGIQAYRKNQVEQARIWHEEALSARRSLGNQRDISESLFNLGLIAAMRGQWDESERLLEEAIMLARAVNDPARELNYASNLGYNRARTGRISEGRALLLETLERARELGYSQAEADCIKFLGLVESMAGNDQAALEFLEQALALYGPDDRGADRTAAKLAYAQTLLSLERIDESTQALDHLEESRILARQPGNRSHYLRLRAHLAGLDGEDAIQHQLLKEAVEVSRISGDQNRVVDADSALVLFYLNTEQLDQARGVLAELPESARTRPESLLLSAELAWQEGNMLRANELMEQAREIMGERWTQTRQARLEKFRSDG